jgi:metal-responsive CopG/Arc/MetJ family transcriptional regulator
MKSIQVQFDEDLLARLDASEEVQQLGRSEVLQQATTEYLSRRCQDRETGAAIAEQYRKAYEQGIGLDRDFEGWEDQGSWPSE